MGTSLTEVVTKSNSMRYESMSARFFLPQRVQQMGWHCHVSAKARSQACAHGETRTVTFRAAFLNGRWSRKAQNSPSPNSRCAKQIDYPRNYMGNLIAFEMCYRQRQYRKMVEVTAITAFSSVHLMGGHALPRRSQFHPDCLSYDAETVC